MLARCSLCIVDEFGGSVCKFFNQLYLTVCAVFTMGIVCVCSVLCYKKDLSVQLCR